MRSNPFAEFEFRAGDLRALYNVQEGDVVSLLVGRKVGSKLTDFMAICTIPLSRLETDLKKTLDECADSGQTLVVEMPDQRSLAIQPLDPQEEDSLMDELLALSPTSQELVAKSKRRPPKPFLAGDDGRTNG